MIYKLTLLSICATLIFSSCMNNNKGISSSPNKIKRDTIPFSVTEGNNIKFNCILDQVDTIDLYFDTGGTQLVILNDALKTKTSLLKGKNNNYSGEAFDPLEEPSSLSIGALTWDSLTVFPAPIGPKEMAGHFGWDLFDKQIVELNYDDNILVVHPDINNLVDGYEKLAIEYTHTLFCIQATLKVNGQDYPNRYLFDTGFQRAIVLDKQLREEENFPTDLPVIKESKLKNSSGDIFINKVINSDQFCFANLCSENVPAQLIVTPNPARFKTNILGNELLKRYNTIFDFKAGYVYLKQNSLAPLPYADASK